MFFPNYRVILHVFPACATHCGRAILCCKILFVSCNMCRAGFPAVHYHPIFSTSISRRDDSCVYCAYAYLLIVASVSLIWSCSRLAVAKQKRASDVARREMLVMVIERIAFSQCLESHPMALIGAPALGSRVPLPTGGNPSTCSEVPPAAF